MCSKGKPPSKNFPTLIHQIHQKLINPVVLAQGLAPNFDLGLQTCTICISHVLAACRQDFVCSDAQENECGVQSWNLLRGCGAL